MKTVFSNLLVFCLGLFICVAIIACANDTDDYSDNTIALLSSQIAALTERITSVENNIKKSTPPMVLSTETYDRALMDSFVKCETKYEFDEQGRIIKITEISTNSEGSDTGVTNVTYDENKCTLVRSDSYYTNQVVFTFDDNGLSNINAVNNLIVSVFTERQ